VLIDIEINFAEINVPDGLDVNSELEEETPNHYRWTTYEQSNYYEESRSLFSRTCTGPIRFTTLASYSGYGLANYYGYGLDISRWTRDHLYFEEERFDEYNAPMVLLGNAKLPSRTD
jgi:hypothetical protein